MRDYSLWYHPFCWLLPFIPPIYGTASGHMGYTFGTYCLPQIGYYTRSLLMIPLAVFIMPSIPMNIHVLLKIAWVAKKRNASIPTILRLQLRFFALCTTLLFIFLFYWVSIFWHFYY